MPAPNVIATSNSHNTKDALMVKPEKTALIAGVSSKGAVDWLNAIPSSTTDLRLESRQFQIAAALRLRAPLCSQHKCACGEQGMSDGNHGLPCSKIRGRNSRHRQANDIIKHAPSRLTTLRVWSQRVCVFRQLSVHMALPCCLILKGNLQSGTSLVVTDSQQLMQQSRHRKMPRWQNWQKPENTQPMKNCHATT